MRRRNPADIVQYKLRMPAHLHAKLEKEAAKYSRTLNDELVRRLGASFEIAAMMADAAGRVARADEQVAEERQHSNALYQKYIEVLGEKKSELRWAKIAEFIGRVNSVTEQSAKIEEQIAHVSEKMALFAEVMPVLTGLAALVQRHGADKFMTLLPLPVAKAKVEAEADAEGDKS
jgi:hypothetical protein